MKGQVTAFIILGLVIILTFGFILYLYTSIDNPQSSSKSEAISLKACLDQSLSSGIFRLGIYTGHMNPGPYKNLSHEIPKIESARQELKEYLTNELKKCISEADVELTPNGARASMLTEKENLASRQEESSETRIDFQSMMESAQTDSWFMEGPYEQDVLDDKDAIIVIMKDTEPIYPGMPYRFAFALQKESVSK